MLEPPAGGDDDAAGGGGGQPTEAAVSLCLTALKQHCAVFAPARVAATPKEAKGKGERVPQARKEEMVDSVAAYYHANSGVSSRHVAKRRPGRPRQH